MAKLPSSITMPAINHRTPLFTMASFLFLFAVEGVSSLLFSLGSKLSEVFIGNNFYELRIMNYELRIMNYRSELDLSDYLTFHLATY
jgi:hypothetical protein